MTAAPITESRLARAAAKYAAQGWAIVPLHSAPGGVCSCRNATCPSPGKHPRTANGLLDASSDAATVAGWWARWPDANIGFPPGRSGFVVVDLDGPTGEALAQAAGLLAEPTLEVVTGRADGGRHRWYRHPGGHVPNGAPFGAGLDVRGDKGYVLLPPSVHPSGRVYTWRGTLGEIGDLPPTIVGRLQGTPDAQAGPRPDQLPAWMIPWQTVGEGGRNNTMTRFVGLCYRQGDDAATVLAKALGVNSRWTPPLGADEVETIVKSIGAREATRGQRQTSTGTTLRAEPPTPAEEAPPSLAALAFAQAEAAVAAGRIDHSHAPRWAWTDLDALLGPMLPGDLIIVGALTGNGKTAYLTSQAQAWADEGRTVLYVPLELDPQLVRRQWAAWRCGFEWSTVARNEWDKLPEGARERHEDAIAEQIANGRIHLPPDRRITLPGLAAWVARAVDEVGANVVVVDHFHRMDFGGPSANYRVQVTESARGLKDLGRTHGIPIVAAAQLNQDPHPLDRYYPPVLKRLKESAGLSEEADDVVMLSRRLKHEVDAEVLARIKSGHAEVRDYEERNIMLVTCRKKRLDDNARDRSARLAVTAGRVENLAPEWRTIRDPRWEP